MPKPTFFNLPAAKRQAITEAAIDEFTAQPYAAASISRIVARAAIAKGSFYQYFADKQDLFLYLLDYAGRRQLALLQREALPDPDLPFFPFLRRQMQASLAVGMADPRLAKLLYRAYYDELPFREAALAGLRETGRGYLEDLVRQGMACGDLDPDLDPGLAAFVIGTISGELGHYVLVRLGLDPRQTTWDGFTALQTPELERIFDDLIALLAHGLGKRP
jgi:AcrR family transcriptional regulator